MMLFVKKLISILICAIVSIDMQMKFKEGKTMNTKKKGKIISNVAWFISCILIFVVWLITKDFNATFWAITALIFLFYLSSYLTVV
jgi:putative exporter of polyketide antibiotics